MMRPIDREIFHRMVAALLMGVLALVAILVATTALSGCSQMPVLKGQYAEDKVAQAKVDSRQSDRIADVVALEDGMGTVLTVVAPEEAKPQVQALRSKITAVRAKADSEAAQGRERADLAERELQDVNSSPGVGAWLQAGLGALSGNFSGLMELLLGALGAGGAFQALRYRSRAQRMAAKAETYAEMDPEVAKKVVEVDEDLAKHRRKGKK